MRFGRGDGSKNSPILPFSTAFLSRIKPSKNNGFRAYLRAQLCIHNFTNWLYRVQIVHGFRFHNRHLGTPIAQILTNYFRPLTYMPIHTHRLFVIYFHNITEISISFLMNFVKVCRSINKNIIFFIFHLVYILKFQEKCCII